jgi:hypothetical protein
MDYIEYYKLQDLPLVNDNAISFINKILEKSWGKRSEDELPKFFGTYNSKHNKSTYKTKEQYLNTLTKFKNEINEASLLFEEKLLKFNSVIDDFCEEWADKDFGVEDPEFKRRYKHILDKRAAASYLFLEIITEKYVGRNRNSLSEPSSDTLSPGHMYKNYLVRLYHVDKDNSSFIPKFKCSIDGMLSPFGKITEKITGIANKYSYIFIPNEISNDTKKVIIFIGGRFNGRAGGGTTELWRKVDGIWKFDSAGNHWNC